MILEVDDRGLIVACASCGQKNRLAWDRPGDTVRCGQCKHDLARPSTPLEVARTEDFDTLVGCASLPIVVDYWAPWCGPCRMVGPELEKVARRNVGRFLVVKVNTDVLSDLGQRFTIRSIPTMAVFANGREVARTTGARPAADIETFVEEATKALHHGGH
jgi:thioredoxin 2